MISQKKNVRQVIRKYCKNLERLKYTSNGVICT